MRLELSPDERRELIILLETRIEELGPEIHHTEGMELKDDLQKDRKIFLGLLERLRAGADAAK